MLASFEYHIVRILKTDPEIADVFEGIVESGENGRKTFKSFEELKEIMDSKRRNEKRRDL